MFRSGMIGLPNAGKSTLFNALAEGKAAVAPYPFCTIEPNVGVVPIPDERLRRIAEVVEPERLTPATIEFVDIAGLVQGASRGEGLGNQFLAHVREMDALLHVVRCFDEGDVSHVGGGLDPRRDIEWIHTELILADLESIEKRLERLVRLAKSGDKVYKDEQRVLEKVQARLQEGVPVRRIALEPGELNTPLQLLTAKPTIYVANVGEDGENDYSRVVAQIAAEEMTQAVSVCAAMEAELVQLDPEEMAAFREELGVEESGLARVIRSAFAQLDLITFYTVKGPEARAWPIPQATPAPQAAGKIHTDMERGFIRAEVIGWEDLISSGGFARARELGKMRSEGKEYLVADGDVILFRFNV